jgi:plasmid stability protein
MSADFWVAAGCAIATAAFIGYEHGRRVEAEEQRIERQAQASIEPRPVVNLIGCPVSQDRLIEWHRVCRARDRTERIKPKGG